MRTLVVALLTVGVAACAQAPHGPAASAASGTKAASSHADAATLTAAQALALLPQYHWQLIKAVDPRGQRVGALFARPDQPLQLDFTAHGVAVSNTCNRMRATYSTAGSDIRIGSMAATLMACNDPKLTALDQAATKTLGGAREYMVSKATPPELVLMTADGRLTFTGVPTPETRFGGTGTTEFLEVAPDKVACNDPLKPNAQCLRVRQLHYNAQGLRDGNPGAWQVLAQPIEGYTHEAGVHNVLRVKRFDVKNPPADASSVAYVLDMVVQTGTAPAASH